jgi:lipid-binding SYLF domain-containing protein
MDAPDSAIPDSIMGGAKCIAIIPSSLKAGFIIGANYGKGVATCRTAKGWSAPAFFRLTGGSFGLQIGGQASDLVLVIRTDRGMQNLLQSKFKMGGDASAAAGPVGRDAQAATDLTMRAQILTYSRARGLFAGISLNGSVINQDGADTRAFYGKEYTYRSVLGGEVPAPADANPLLQMVEKYAPTPKPHVAPSVSAPQPAAAVTTGGATASANTTSHPQPATAADADAQSESPATQPVATAPAKGGSE